MEVIVDSSGRDCGQEEVIVDSGGRDGGPEEGIVDSGGRDGDPEEGIVDSGGRSRLSRTCLGHGRFRLVVLPFFLPFLLSVSLSFSVLIAPGSDRSLDVVLGNMGRNVKGTQIFPFDEGLPKVKR